jgi:kynureninase
MVLGVLMNTYLELMLRRLPEVEVITPRETKQRGAQLSLRIQGHGTELLADLAKEGVICDFREPNIIRVAAVPLYTRYHDLNKFTEILSLCLKKL